MSPHRSVQHNAQSTATLHAGAESISKRRKAKYPVVRRTAPSMIRKRKHLRAERLMQNLNSMRRKGGRQRGITGSKQWKASTAGASGDIRRFMPSMRNAPIRGQDGSIDEPQAVKDARAFTTLVHTRLEETEFLRDDVRNVLHGSIAELQKLSRFSDLKFHPETQVHYVDPRELSNAVSYSIALRKETLARLSRIPLIDFGHHSPMSWLCHFYRMCVKNRTDAAIKLDPGIYAVYMQWFFLQSRSADMHVLALELKDRIHSTDFENIPRFNVVMFREKLSRHAMVAIRVSVILRKMSPRSRDLALSTGDGAALGHTAAKLFWSNSGISLLVQHLHELYPWYAEGGSLFPLSTQYPESTEATLSKIDFRLGTICESLARCVRQLRNVNWAIYRNAIVAGKSGALALYATKIREQVIEDYRHRYRSDPPSHIRDLRRWGYKPSVWYRRMLLGKPYFHVQRIRKHEYERVWKYSDKHVHERVTRKHVSDKFASKRRQQRSKRAKFLKQLSSPWRVRYCGTRKEERRLRSQAYKEGKRQRSLRQAIRARRTTALGKMRRVLSSTLLSYQAQTVKSVRSADWLAVLPKSERPSGSTLAGRTIATLGFYDMSNELNNNIKTNYLRKVDPVKKTSGQPLVRYKKDSGENPMRILPQFRPRFHSTPRMRAAHPTAWSFDSDVWERSVEVPTNTTANGAMDGDSSSSPSGQGSEYKSDADHPRSDSSGEQHPSGSPNDHNSQPPGENMDKAADEDTPSESEHEDEPDHPPDEESDPEEPEEHHTPLSYQIPPAVLQNALQALPQTRASYWSQRLYRGPEDEELLLHYCTSMEVSERVAKHFVGEKVLGFDIEWKPFGHATSIKENASLIQLASENRIALFHIARFPGKTAKQLLPRTLRVVLESQDTLKVGVAIKGDCSRLQKHLGVDVRGVFELSRLHNLVEYYATEPSKVSNKLVKLATQVHQHLLLPLYKGEPLADEQKLVGSVRESDWSRPLDFDQIQYAAADAYAGLRLFDVLESKRKKLKPTPPIPRMCDYDNRPAPRTAPKAKRARKAKSPMEKVVAESLSGLEAEDANEEAYETAPEELAGDEDGDADSESASGVSDENEDPDADYIPKSRGRTNLGRRSTDVSAVPDAPAHRIGRVALSRLAGADPGHSKLPAMSDDAATSSDESSAFDPPTARVRRRPEKKAVQGEEATSTKTKESDDEYPDSELEEAFLSMDVDEPIEAASNLVAGEQPDEMMQDLDTSIEPARESEASASTAPPAPASDTTAHSPEFILATSWAQNYLNTTIPSPNCTAPSRIRATVPPLRAYHFWHHQRISLDAIGAHLRDPPLAQSTVGSYIIQAINMEKLEYRDADLAALMGTLPANLRLGRYAWLSRKLGVVR